MKIFLKTHLLQSRKLITKLGNPKASTVRSGILEVSQDFVKDSGVKKLLTTVQ